MGQLEKPFVFVRREIFGWKIGRSLNSSRLYNMSVLYVRNRRSLICQMQRCGLFDTSAGSNCCALLFCFFLAHSHVRLARSLFVSHCARVLVSLSLFFLHTHTYKYTHTKTNTNTNTQQERKTLSEAIRRVVWCSLSRAQCLSRACSHARYM